MLAALAADLSRVDGVSVDVLRDRRLSAISILPGCTIHDGRQRRRRAASDRCALAAADADWIVVIAPEFDGHLTRRARLGRAGRRPAAGAALSTIVAWRPTSTRRPNIWPRAACACRAGVALAAGDRLPVDFPLSGRAQAARRRRLAGRRVRSSMRQRSARAPVGTTGRAGSRAYCPGTAASVACLCGPRQIVPLAALPCRRSADDGRFRLPRRFAADRPEPLAERARRLAPQAVGTLGEAVGYLGVDLVLGDDPAGATTW